MSELEALRPEVRRIAGLFDDSLKTRSVFSDGWQIIRAELMRLAKLEEERWAVVATRNGALERAEKAEAELAALKARIAGSSVVKIANYGDPFIVLPDHFTVPNSLKGKTVRLVVEE